MNSLKDKLLISVPHMNDDIFGHSVIYICEHNLQGAMGLIVNKPVNNISFNDLKNVNHIGKDHFEKLQNKFFFGGPILVEKIMALHSNKLKIETAIPLNKNVSISNTKEIIENIKKDINLNYKLFCGYSGWGPGQLEREVENGDWLLQSFKIDLLFDCPAELTWEIAIKSLGINIIDIPNMSGSA